MLSWTMQRTHRRAETVGLEFSPPNVAAIVQPFDQDIIKYLKVLHKGLMLQQIITCFESDEECKITLLSVMRMTTRARGSVKPEVIANSLKKCCFMSTNPLPTMDATGDACSADKLFFTEVYFLPAFGSFLNKYFANVDNGIKVCGPLMANVSCRSIEGDNSEDGAT